MQLFETPAVAPASAVTSHTQRGGARVAIRRLVDDTGAYLTEVVVPVAGTTAHVGEKTGGARFTIQQRESLRGVRVVVTPDA